MGYPASISVWQNAWSFASHVSLPVLLCSEFLLVLYYTGMID
jgi:hypothetical protein